MEKRVTRSMSKAANEKDWLETFSEYVDLSVVRFPDYIHLSPEELKLREDAYDKSKEAWVPNTRHMSVGVVLRDKDHRYLFVCSIRRKKWGFPKGSQEFNKKHHRMEYPEETAKRELFEETGLCIEIPWGCLIFRGPWNKMNFLLEVDEIPLELTSDVGTCAIMKTHLSNLSFMNVTASVNFMLKHYSHCATSFTKTTISSNDHELKIMN